MVISRESPPTINLNKEFPDHLLLVYKQLIKNLQQRFDLSRLVLADWLETAEFQEESHKLYEELEEKMLINISDDANIRQLRNIYHAEQPLEYLSKYLGWERERCGHLLHKYDNGYHIYCNRYRHLHDPDKNDDNSKEKILEANHKFIYKTYQQLIDEKIFEAKLVYYQEFINQVLIKLQSRIDRHLNNSYQVIRVRWITNTIDADTAGAKKELASREAMLLLLQWLKTHPDCFKSKFGLMRLREAVTGGTVTAVTGGTVTAVTGGTVTAVTGGTATAVTGRAATKKTGGKAQAAGVEEAVVDASESHEEQYLDVFLPKDKTSDYLAEWSDLTQNTALLEHFLLKEK